MSSKERKQPFNFSPTPAFCMRKCSMLGFSPVLKDSTILPGSLAWRTTNVWNNKLYNMIPYEKCMCVCVCECVQGNSSLVVKLSDADGVHVKIIKWLSVLYISIYIYIYIYINKNKPLVNEPTVSHFVSTLISRWQHHALRFPAGASDNQHAKNGQDTECTFVRHFLFPWNNTSTT